MLTRLTHDLVQWVGMLDVSRWLVITLILVGYIVLGSFMDQIAILVLTIQVVLPLIKSLGFDPLWFRVVKIVTAEVGMITPPIGLNCFIVARHANRPVSEVFHGIFPQELRDQVRAVSQVFTLAVAKSATATRKLAAERYHPDIV